MSQPLTIWYITDNKPGHLNQLKGLSQQLNHRSRHMSFQLDEQWISFNSLKLNWCSLLGQVSRQAHTSTPAIVIGAGHKTHLKLLAIGRKFNAYTVVLMRPSLPLRLFDAAIIPAHDHPPERSNILKTKGVLNTVQPKQPVNGNVAEQNGLILIGGESKHFVWNSNDILNQIHEIVSVEPSTQWTLSNSRRTPANFLQRLKTTAQENLNIVDCDNTDGEWLPDQIKKASKVWVTPDSVSMVYEAITSGTPTGLFALNTYKKNRINSGIQQLTSDGMVTTFKQWQADKQLHEPAQLLWESDRAAEWLLNHIRQNQTQ